MEYFLGTISALLTLVILNHFLTKKISKPVAPLRISQSYIFELIRPFTFDIEIQIPLRSQASKHYDEGFLRVLFFEQKAYWIKDNALYVADIIDNQVDEETTVQVDTMGMNKVELDKTIFIVEKLREGLTNDFGYPGNTQF